MAARLHTKPQYLAPGHTLYTTDALTSEDINNYFRIDLSAPTKLTPSDSSQPLPTTTTLPSSNSSQHNMTSDMRQQQEQPKKRLQHLKPSTIFGSQQHYSVAQSKNLIDHPNFRKT
ncbi:unnamed protein product [Didymodactylos carnosus]|nr:unnamed protein product [Didymodactylos carnosus]CAF4415088.1 unnamed protein product [Didymodactylos carnosus]